MLELADVTQQCVSVTNTLYDEVTEGSCQQSNSSVTPLLFSTAFFPPIPHLIVFHPAARLMSLEHY